MKEHIYPYVDEEHEIECPYCGTPLVQWVQESGDVEWEEVNNGCFKYKETCEQCGRRVKYQLNFVVTCAVVEEEGGR